MHMGNSSSSIPNYFYTSASSREPSMVSTALPVTLPPSLGLSEHQAHGHFWELAVSFEQRNVNKAWTVG